MQENKLKNRKRKERKDRQAKKQTVHLSRAKKLVVSKKFVTALANENLVGKNKEKIGHAFPIIFVESFNLSMHFESEN